MNSERSLIELKRKVKKHKIPTALLHCLRYTEKNKQDAAIVGAIWIDADKFILNTGIFSRFTDQKIHTVNRNLREHGFNTKKMNHFERTHYFNILKINPPFEKSWCLRNHKDFTRFSDECSIDQIPYTATPKKTLRNKDEKFDHSNQNEIESNDTKSLYDYAKSKSLVASEKADDSDCSQIDDPLFDKNLSDFNIDDDDDLFGPCFSDLEHFFF